MNTGESKLGRAYRRIYQGFCGRHPYLLPWHFQYLDAFYLNRSLRQLLPTLTGRVLDAGCGGKPYRNWFGSVTEYVGLDVMPGPSVDVVVQSNEQWPLPNEYFDVVLSSQVLEHVEHLELTLAEMNRVLKRGGVMILSFPFIYNEHGAPWDFQRFTAYRAQKLFPSFEILRLERHGGIGSTLTILWLNWIEQSLNQNFITRLLKALFLPLWITVSLIMNLMGLAFDRIDRTGAFYNNLLIVIKK